MLRWLNALESKLNTLETGKRLPEEALLGIWNILTAGNKRVASCLLGDVVFYVIGELSLGWGRWLKNLWKKTKSSLNKQVPGLVSRLHLPSQGLVSDQPFWLIFLAPPASPPPSKKSVLLRPSCDAAAHCAWAPPCFFPADCFSVAVEAGGFTLSCGNAAAGCLGQLLC